MILPQNKNDILSLSLKTDTQLVNENAMIIEGYTLVERLFASDLEPRGIIATNTAYEKIRKKVPHDIPLLVKDTKEISSFLGYPFHRGVIAIANRPPMQRIDDLQRAMKSEKKTYHLFALCTEIQEGSNLGAIIRSARAFDLSGIILGPKTADPWTRKAIRASAGQVFFQNLYEIDGDNTSDSQELLYEKIRQLAHKQGYTISCLDLDPHSIPLSPKLQKKNRFLVLGHEFNGIQKTWNNFSDETLSIPMPGGIDSLNVAVAAGIAFFALNMDQ